MTLVYITTFVLPLRTLVVTSITSPPLTVPLPRSRAAVSCRTGCLQPVLRELPTLTPLAADGDIVVQSPGGVAEAESLGRPSGTWRWRLLRFL